MAFVKGKDKFVQLTYSFIFKRADNIWNHVYDFEHDLEGFFESKQLEGEIIPFIEGSSGTKTIYLKNVEKEMTLRNDKQAPQQVPKAKKPQSGFKTVKKLVDQVNKSYKKR